MASEILFVYDLHLLAKHFAAPEFWRLGFQIWEHLPRHNACDEHHQYDKIEQ